MKKEDPDVNHAHDAVHFLSRLDAGDLMVEFGKMLKQLHKKVQMYQQNGEITLKILLEAHTGNPKQMPVVPSLKISKMPKQEFMGGVFWHDSQSGRITERNPEDKKFDFVETVRSRIEVVEGIYPEREEDLSTFANGGTELTVDEKTGEVSEADSGNNENGKP